jgi:alpha-glucosidase (family GH31 glycosyl hydrolase)
MFLKPCQQYLQLNSSIETTTIRKICRYISPIEAINPYYLLFTYLSLAFIKYLNESAMKKKLLVSISCVLFILFSNAQTISWANKGFSVQVNDNAITVLQNDKTLLDITSINFNFEAPIASSVLKLSSDSMILVYTYPSYAKYGNEDGALTATITISVENNALHFQSNPKWARNTTIQLKDDTAHYFGLVEHLYPNNRKSPDLRGNVVDIDAIGNDNQYHENYSSVWSAFYMTNKGYASFYDTYAKGKYTLGINGVTELYHQTNKLDWYIIPGNNGDEILKTYYSIIGRPKFVPMWACGPVGWRDENKGGKDEILDDIQKMTDLKIPFTAWMVDRPYCNGANEWSKMDFNARFAHPEEWIKTINDKYHLQFMTWIASLTFEDTSFPGLLPNYKNYMDLTNPAAIKEFENRLKTNQYSVNVRGHKMDRAEEDLPEASAWYDKTPEPERRAKYLFLYSKVTDDFLRNAYKDDQFNYARGAYQHCQLYLSAIWSGDSRSSWDGYASSIANGIRTDFMGFPVWGSDVGGYLGGRIPEKLYARWLAFGAWSGLFEIKLDDAGGKGPDRTPWKYSTTLQSIFKKYCDLRLKMQPFIYSSVNTSYKNGTAMKPLAYLYPTDENTYAVWDEYMFGNTFLVAPITDSTDKRTIYLPAGEWYDYDNPSVKFNGNQSFTINETEDRIPVFIKANSIWVEGTFDKGNASIWDNTQTDALQFYYFPSHDTSVTFDYVDYKDGNKEKQVNASYQKNQVQLDVPNIAGKNYFNIKLDGPPEEVWLNNKKVNTNWNEQTKILNIALSQNRSSYIRIVLYQKYQWR